MDVEGDAERTGRRGVQRAARQPRRSPTTDERTSRQRSRSPSRCRPKSGKTEAVGAGSSKGGGEREASSPAVATCTPPRSGRGTRGGETRPRRRLRGALARAATSELRDAASEPTVAEERRGRACLGIESSRRSPPRAAPAAAGNAVPSAPLEVSAALQEEGWDALGGTVGAGSCTLPPSPALGEPRKEEDRSSSSSSSEEEPLPSLYASPGFFQPKKDDLVWCKYQRWPYFPAVVKRVSKEKGRRRCVVLFFSLKMQSSAEKLNAIGVTVKHIKPFNCREKYELIAEAKKSCPREMDLYLELITDYWSKTVSGSGMGKTFIEYCKSEQSAPVWHGISSSPAEPFRDVPEAETAAEDDERRPDGDGRREAESPSVASVEKRLLPDRQKILRRRCNERLLHAIVRRGVAERHLRRLLRGAVPSPWLLEFQQRRRRRPSELHAALYLEDDAHVERLTLYLLELYERVRAECAAEGRAAEGRAAAFYEVDAFDLSQFILDVLLPEAITYALMATEEITWEQARIKFLNGPKCSRREIELFNKEFMKGKGNGS
ncbi:LOW QUALITY PROTEIN: PWWP domain-containing DNA repair factor 3A-like [Lethenteron reissneri]|uniref:LOW QUALITY PROTEIN: PWWP domain-containing DNA repair factor 3A-like n=1 Tax=Lethenteron reissneri TaxID=7753 RepID=UPI002AB7010E|nr:LOW QUALITY PROTEIN: PWWP domain-containing DNA repair factor 3A-like [Lethenteron reissneri]